MKYRFKTKEEFEREFGSNWRETVPDHWVTDMDPLLGTPVPLDINGQKFSGKRMSIPSPFGNWTISPEMVTQYPLMPMLLKSKSKLVKLNQSF